MTSKRGIVSALYESLFNLRPDLPWGEFSAYQSGDLRPIAEWIESQGAGPIVMDVLLGKPSQDRDFVGIDNEVAKKIILVGRCLRASVDLQAYYEKRIAEGR